MRIYKYYIEENLEIDKLSRLSAKSNENWTKPFSQRFLQIIFQEIIVTKISFNIIFYYVNNDFIYIYISTLYRRKPKKYKKESPNISKGFI